MKVDDLKDFLHRRIKVEGKLNNLEQVTLEAAKNKVTIISDEDAWICPFGAIESGNSFYQTESICQSNLSLY